MPCSVSMGIASPVVEAAAAAVAAAADIAVAEKAAARTVCCHNPDTVVVPGQRSKPPTAWLVPVAATADAARTLAMLSSTRSAHLQTCLQIAPETSEYPAAVLQLATLEEEDACDAPGQRSAAGCRAEAGVVKQSDHRQLVKLLLCHAVDRSAGGTADHTGTAVEAARCLEAVEAEADSSGRLLDDFHLVGAEEGAEHSWRKSG